MIFFFSDRLLPAPSSLLRRRNPVCLFLLLLGPFSSLQGGGEAAATAPAVNWVLPLFTDREGHRSMTLRGSSVRPGSGGSIAVSDLSITIYSGDADARVDSILLSPSAIFFPKENRAHGDKAARFIQDTIEVTGVGWDYDHAAKRVSIHSQVRVTFRAQLNDILK